jgi:hypothetical protein
MSTAADTERQSAADVHPHRDALVAELEQRIDELVGHDEAELGGFSTVDWIILVLGALVVPILLVIRFAP